VFKWILLIITVVFWIIYIYPEDNEAEESSFNMIPLNEKIVLTPNSYLRKSFVSSISTEYYLGFEFGDKKYAKDFGKYFDFEIYSENKNITIDKSINHLLTSGDDFGYSKFELIEDTKYTLIIKFDSIPPNLSNESIKVKIGVSRAVESVGYELGKSFSQEYDYTLKIVSLVIMILLTLFVLILFGLHYKNKY